jgi:acyl-coenzyme A thioesterase PaaI-like protein
MSSSQQNVTRAVLDSVHDFLGGPTRDGEEWCFEFGDQLHSNWGDVVHGGAVAAGMLAVARAAAPERSPRSMHVQIVRSMPSGPAWATAAVRHPGRTVATVEVDLYDQRRKLAAIALMTMVTPDAVAAEYDHAAAAPPFRAIEVPLPPVPESRIAPITATLQMATRGEDVGLKAKNVRPSVDGSVAGLLECVVPWDDLEPTGPEAACLLADAAVGLAFMDSYIPLEHVGPNADLTLRFSTAPATRVIAASSTMLSVQRGTATVGVEVQAGDNQLAHGLATSLLLHGAS